MWEDLGLRDSLRMFSFLMLSFAFFVGIMLVVSQEAFEIFNRALLREIGLRKRLLPGIEDTKFSFVDFVILKFPLVAGLIISVSSFILLLIYK